jgi:hypothetical protein
MTDVELVALRAQVMRLQEQAEHRAQVWGKLRKIAGGLALLVAVAALGFIVTGILLDPKSFPTAHQFAQMMGYQLLFTSLPLGLLTQALQVDA